MPRQPWTNHQLGFDYLRVPSHTQPTDEADCVVYSLWMVTNYVGNEFPDRTVRDATNVPTIDHIKEFIRTDQLGWRPNQDDLTELSSSVSSVSLSLESWTGDPPRGLLNLAEECLADSLPLVAFIDAQQLRRGIRGSGPLHAVVIVGLNDVDAEVAIADPWFTAIHSVAKDNLEDAWDPSHHQIIDVDLNRSNSSTSGADS